MDASTQTETTIIEKPKKPTSAKALVKTKCEICDGSYTTYNKTKHQKTSKHIAAQAKLEVK